MKTIPYCEMPKGDKVKVADLVGRVSPDGKREVIVGISETNEPRVDRVIVVNITRQISDDEQTELRFALSEHAAHALVDCLIETLPKVSH